MGALVIESLRAQPRGGAPELQVRLSGGLTLHLGCDTVMTGLLAHLFGGCPRPEIAGAAVEFVLNGAAHLWQADFQLSSCELSNRSTNQRLTGPAEIAAYLDRQLGTDLVLRAAAFVLPAPRFEPPRAARERPGTPPPADGLAEQLAHYEARLRRSLKMQETGTALYSDLFPLLESQEQAATRLQARLLQLERHQQAELALTSFRNLERQIQERIDAGRKAAQLERQIAEQDRQADRMARVPAEALQRAGDLEEEARLLRAGLIEKEKARKSAAAQERAIRTSIWWWIALVGAALLAAGLIARPWFAAAGYAALLGLGLLPAAVVALLRSTRRSAYRRLLRQRQAAVEAGKTELELAELAVTQHLRAWQVTSRQALIERAESVAAWWAEYEAAAAELARLRQVSCTDDGIRTPALSESAQLAELEQRCRELSPYRLTEADRQTVERMVQELESEARYQKEAAAVLQKQCQELSLGWSGVPELAEQVAALRLRLQEWLRWEKAFRRIREVIDHLPDPGRDRQLPGRTRASALLERISQGRWSEVAIDPGSGAFRIFDRHVDLWIGADRDNPAVRSSIDLAYRLSLLEDPRQPVHMPLWLSEPFAELPAAMAEAAAGLLAETARKRQVVLVCRERPAVKWPQGATLQG